MLSTRPLHVLRPSLLPPLRASSSRIPLRTAQSDRYLLIREFFTRQSSLNTSPGPPPPFRPRSPLIPRRWNSTTPSSSPSSGKTPSERPKDCPHCGPTPSNIPATPPPPTIGPAPGHAQDYTPFIRRLIQQSQLLKANAPHRPTKEQLLEAASSWWERLRIRIKWFTIRGWRRFNTDDLSAFASWFVLGNTLWILIGTTTFVSAVFATLNSLSLQEYVARWISDYLTSETGVTVIFESAIVPRWGASTITFRNVYISRRAESFSQPDNATATATATATANPSGATRTKAATAKPPSPTPFLSSELTPATYMAPRAAETDNYTMFDVNVDEVEVALSFMRWLDGKGLVKDAKVKGVRGVIDRRSVWWDVTKPLNPADWRHATRPGDFELETLAVEDALVTVYQPGGQRPYNVSVFNAAIGPLRKRWLFYDIISAEGITGQFDNCLFSLHMPQKLGKVQGDEGRLIKRMARFRIDGLPIEHAQYATGHTGPMSWITSGKLDAVLDIKFPYHPDEQVDFKAIFEEIGRNVVTISHGAHPDVDHEQQHAHSSNTKETVDAAIEASAAAEATSGAINPGQHRLARPPLRAPDASRTWMSQREGQGQERREVTVDIDLRFRDLKAAVPMFTSDLSVTNNALIRPIVAFINANRTLVPIHCQVAADLSDFDGSWTLFETGLMTSVSDQIYDALAYHVSSETANSKRIRQVSVWGIQRGAEVLLDALRNVVDPAHAQLLATL